MRQLFLSSFLSLVLLASSTGLSFAAIESKQFANTELESRYSDLISELRCLVCKNQNLADSDADLAKDLRDRVEIMLKKGSSDAEVIDFMVVRYGDFILYRPPFRAATALLWLGPLIILLIGFTLFLYKFRNRHDDLPLVSDAALKQAKQLLNDDNKTD